jgi:P2-related tail formation protein
LINRIKRNYRLTEQQKGERQISKQEKMERIKDSLAAISKKTIVGAVRQTLKHFEKCLKKQNPGAD